MIKQALILVCLWVVTPTALGDTSSADSIVALHTSLYAASAEDAARVLLVLHRGRSQSRVMGGARLNMYRGRGYSNNATWNHRVGLGIARRHRLDLLADWWMSELNRHCTVLRVPPELPLEDAIALLRNDIEVSLVQQMATFATMASAYSDPFYELQAAAGYFNLPDLHRQATGKNIRIAIVDTGIETQHPDLQGQIIGTRNFVADVSPGFSRDTHGTALAGIIAAHSDNQQGIVGIAPHAKLYGLKACWPVSTGAVEARCNSFTLAQAINRALALDADIINLSLAGPHDEIIASLIAEAIRRGIIVVAASNSASNETFPASLAGVIGVTSAPAGRLEVDAGYIAAPGEEIITTIPHGQYNFLSGSSLAAAHISGYMALLKQNHPGSTVGELRRKLFATDFSPLPGYGQLTNLLGNQRALK